MAVIHEDELKKNIAGRQFLPVYLLFGEDSYLKGIYMDKIVRGITSEDDVFNYCKFSGKYDLQMVYDAVMQLPVMCERKCVVISDFDYEHCSSGDLERFLELIEIVPESTVLIIYFDTVPADARKSGKFKKILSAAEKRGGAAAELQHRGPVQLKRMLCSGAEKRNCRISSDAAEYMLETCGDDLFILSNELNKLCLFKGGGEITKKDIDEVCTRTVEANIYRLSDFILAKNISGALNVLDNLFYTRTEPMVILYQVSSVYVDMYRVYAAAQRGLSVKDVSVAYGYKNREFLLERAKKNLRKMSLPRLQASIEAITCADAGLKSYSSDARTVLEELAVKLVCIMTDGGAFGEN